MAKMDAMLLESGVRRAPYRDCGDLKQLDANVVIPCSNSLPK
jgi:hypothetical protein